MLENMKCSDQHLVETFGPFDPTGKPQHDVGAKLDAGKIRMSLIMEGFAPALKEVARVGTFGANKYTDNGWKSVPNAKQRYTDALYRHLNTEACGEIYDPETNLHHAAHAAWNALARLYFIIKENQNETSKISKQEIEQIRQYYGPISLTCEAIKHD
jgi:hypothetical protein